MMHMDCPHSAQLSTSNDEDCQVWMVVTPFRVSVGAFDENQMMS